MSKAKVVKLPKGARPLGPTLPPKGSNVLIFPGNNRATVGQSEGKVIFVDFHTRQKIGHVS